MSESLPPTAPEPAALTPGMPAEPDQARIDANYREHQNAHNVRARFKVYDYAVWEAGPKSDIRMHTVDVLRRTGYLATSATIMDIGTADAELLYYLIFECGHKGQLWGIDPNANQFVYPEDLQFDPGEWSQHALLRWRLNPEDLRDLQLSGQVKPLEINNLILRPGRAEDLGFMPDDSVQLVINAFSKYHLSTVQRRLAGEEAQRVLGETGLDNDITSSPANKRVHREIEREDIALRLGIDAPAEMNAGYTTAVANRELLGYFSYLYRLLQAGPIIIKDEEGLDCYLESQRSLRNQYNPVPGIEEFEEVLYGPVRAKIIKAIVSKGAFVDYAERSSFVASQRPLERLLAEGFEEVAA